MKLLIRDGNFSHAQMSRCFFLVQRAITLAPDDLKYSKEFMQNVMFSLPSVRKLMDKYIVNKEFPYGIDLHELLMVYVKWQCTAFSNRLHKYHTREFIENRIILTLKTMLYDPTPTNSADPIKNPLNVCILRGLYICAKISLSVKLIDSMVENITRILAKQLVGIKFYNEKEFARYKADRSSFNLPRNKVVDAFFKDCLVKTDHRMYYFEGDDDDAEADELQPNYELPAGMAENPPSQEIDKAISDLAVMQSMEYFRARLCPDLRFNYQNLASVKQEQDRDHEQPGCSKQGPSQVPVVIQSDNEDIPSLMLRRKPDDSVPEGDEDQAVNPVVQASVSKSKRRRQRKKERASQVNSNGHN